MHLTALSIRRPNFLTYRHTYVMMRVGVEDMATLKRTTIFLTEDQHERLRRVAFERRTSMASLLREAALEVLEDEEDIQEGLKAFAEEEGTISWREYQRSRLKRRT